MDREEYAKSIDSLSVRMSLSPYDDAGRFYLAISRMLNGDYPGAVRDAELAHELNSSRISLGNLVDFHIAAGEYTRATERLQADEGGLRPIAKHRLQAEAFLGSGELDAAAGEIAELERIEGSRSTLVTDLRGRSLLLRGRWESALRLFELADPLDAPASSRFVKQSLILSRLLALAGRNAEAESVLEPIPIDELSLRERALVGGHYGFAGSASGTTRARVSLASEAQADNARHQAYLDVAHGSELAVAGDWASAWGRFDRASRDWVEPLVSRLKLEAAIESSRWEDAKASLDAVIGGRSQSLWLGYGTVDLPLRAYDTARIHMNTGETAEAIRSFETFVEHVSEASEFAVVRAARDHLRDLYR